MKRYVVLLMTAVAMMCFTSAQSNSTAVAESSDANETQASNSIDDTPI
jgi:hypothetical protein